MLSRAYHLIMYLVRRLTWRWRRPTPPPMDERIRTLLREVVERSAGIISYKVTITTYEDGAVTNETEKWTVGNDEYTRESYGGRERTEYMMRGGALYIRLPGIAGWYKAEGGGSERWLSYTSGTSGKLFSPVYHLDFESLSDAREVDEMERRAIHLVGDWGDVSLHIWIDAKSRYLTRTEFLHTGEPIRVVYEYSQYNELSELPSRPDE